MNPIPSGTRTTGALLLILLVSAMLLPGTAPARASWPPPQTAGDAVIEPEVEAAIERGETQVRVIVRLRVQASPSDARALPRTLRRERVIRALQAHAEREQRGLRRLIAQREADGEAREPEYFWIFNGVAVTATPRMIRELANDPSVESVSPNRAIELPPAPAAPGAEPVPPAWNLALVNAPEMWALGWRGQGVVVANLDTGVDASHPELAANYRGGANSWFDPADYPPHPAPVDSAFGSTGHGTGTMGIIAGATTGMAPDAQWIAAKIFSDGGLSTVEIIHLALQWVLDPDGNPATSDGADVVNNSWADQQIQCNSAFDSDLLNLRYAGVVPVFSAGNSATPRPGQNYSPPNSPFAFPVGAIDQSSGLFEQSMLGPSMCTLADQQFPYLVAPGVNVRTPAPGGGYRTWNGTSFAAPHVAGALALLLNAFPNRSTELQEQSLVASAFDLGPAGPDFSYGYGRLDVLAAHNFLARFHATYFPLAFR